MEASALSVLMAITETKDDSNNMMNNKKGGFFIELSHMNLCDSLRIP